MTPVAAGGAPVAVLVHDAGPCSRTRSWSRRSRPRRGWRWRTSASRPRCSAAPSSSPPRAGDRRGGGRAAPAAPARAQRGRRRRLYRGVRPPRRRSRGESTERARPSCCRRRAQLDTARAELRELARGIHPTALTEGGLGAALPELAARARVPVELRVDGGRSPAPVEAAAYFVCAEALTNVAKYARRVGVRDRGARERGRPGRDRPTTAAAVRTRSAAPGFAGSPTASRRSAGGSAWTARAGRGPGSSPRSPPGDPDGSGSVADAPPGA